MGQFGIKMHQNAFSGQAPPGPGNLLDAASEEEMERGKEEERGRGEEGRTCFCKLRGDRHPYLMSLQSVVQLTISHIHVSAITEVCKGAL